MSKIDRRGFIAGLVSLLGTTALVKPLLPEATSTISVDAMWDKILEMEATKFTSLDGVIGRYLGIASFENGELRFERIEPSDFYE